MTLEIPLTIGRNRTQSGLVAVIDDEDMAKTIGQPWRVFLSPWGQVYAISGRSTLLHRQVIGASRGEVVEHRNRDGLDCRKANLILMTHSQHLSRQGSRLMRSRRATSSQFKGVSWLSGPRPWRATISVQGTQHYLGRFVDEEAAARAYDAAAVKAFGSLARINFAAQP